MRIGRQQNKILLIFFFTAALAVFLSFKYYSTPYIPTVTVRELRIEIVTDKEEYYLGESFKATFYIVNDRSTPVKLKPITKYTFCGNSKADPNKSMCVDVNVTPEKGAMIHIPANSRLRLDQVVFKPECLGEFVITGLGASLTVNVIDKVNS